MQVVDLATGSVRELNAVLHALRPDTNETDWTILNPRGAHALAAGLDVPINVTIEGHAGYYCAGMNKRANVTLKGNAGPGLAENIMSGFVHVTGDASQSAAATGVGGIVRIDGNAAARCGIAMKGVSIVVGGSVGHMSAFLAQAGLLVVLGDAGEALGDSIYEAQLFVRGTVKSLGADCIEKPMRDGHKQALADLFTRVGINGTVDPSDFRRFGSARRLYNFHVDNAEAY